MAMDKRKKMLLAASVAGLIATAGAGLFVQSAQAADVEHCYGINACKGMGACGGKAGNSCSGKNACKGQGFVDVAKGSCMKIQGGKLTE